MVPATLFCFNLDVPLLLKLQVDARGDMVSNYTLVA